MTDHVRKGMRVCAFIFMVNVIVPAGLRAAEASVKTSTATTSEAAAGANASHSGGATANNREGIRISDGLGPNSPGSPNMGSPDHTPGTTGTSGQ